MTDALIVWGGWEGHEPGPCAAVIQGILQSNGMAVQVEQGTEVLRDSSISDFKLIVPIITMGEIEKDSVDNLCEAIKSGVGLAGFHGGMGDAFRNSPEYQFMVGGQWVAHPGNIIDYQVNITKPDDPIVSGLTDFDYHSEQYYMHVDPGNEVLATTTFNDEHASWIDGVEMPVVWKRYYGEGRVFYSSLGHDAAEFDVREMRTIISRGMQWAAAGQCGTDTNSEFITNKS